MRGNSAIKGKNYIWIQAVSVGEVNLLKNFIQKLKEYYDYPVLISTTTLTGNRVAKKNLSGLGEIIFFPLDISFIMQKIIRRINPKIFIAVETEIWPNLLFQLKKRGIPSVIINGRISDRAFSRYLKIKHLIKNAINLFNFIGVQNESYKNRFLTLGAKEEKLVKSGNMKFESINPDQRLLRQTKEKYTALLKKQNNLLITAASTHDPEEEIILSAYKELKNKHGNISLLIAPRHVERATLIEKSILKYGFTPARISKINLAAADKDCVFILDTVGELLYFYSLSDINFVGGSLSAYGGHNILEPIYFLKPTCFGPHMDNFKDIEQIVLDKKAGIKVKDAAELKKVLFELVNEESQRNYLRSRCLEVFEQEKAALGKNLEIIIKSVK